MSGKRRQKAAIFIGFGIAFLTNLNVIVNQARPYPILDRNGAALPSLIDGVVAATPFNYVRASPSCQAEKPDLFSRIKKLLTPAVSLRSSLLPGDRMLWPLFCERAGRMRTWM